MKKSILAIIIFTLVSSLCACCFPTSDEPIIWADMILGDTLPEPPSDRGKIWKNNMESLSVEINGVSAVQFANYVEDCIGWGYTEDSDSSSSSYRAFNTDGYKLYLNYWESFERLDVELNKPIEMVNIVWPDSIAGQQLPAPKSTLGKFNYEYEDHFSVYIGDMTRDNYDAYVIECSNAGFNVDYDKSDNRYTAYNSDGWRVYLEYEGNSVISIEIYAPKEDEEIGNIPNSTGEQADVVESINEIIDDSNTVADNNIDPDFKKAMDSYEKFMDEYIAFMKKYEANPDDWSVLADYTNYMIEYAQFVEDYEKWEDEDMNAAELAYYYEVQTRVNQKLLGILQ